ncbi:hypothetical protein TcCL_NonESM04171 [Trypanosoma cruzi]|nr:hypothetical protein TcCL_NonESM04171 [Trypanosoma cruzi]
MGLQHRSPTISLRHSRCLNSRHCFPCFFICIELKLNTEHQSKENKRNEDNSHRHDSQPQQETHPHSVTAQCATHTTCARTTATTASGCHPPSTVLERAKDNNIRVNKNDERALPSTTTAHPQAPRSNIHTAIGCGSP